MSGPLQLLLDTHGFLWWVPDEMPLPRKTARVVYDEVIRFLSVMRPLGKW